MATKVSSSSSSSSSRSCLCSPTTHPGSFRCGRHRQSATVAPIKSQKASQSNTWDVMTNSKTNLLKAFLKQIVKPSGRNIERRRNFQPKPTRFCLMNNNGTNIASVNYGLTVSRLYI